MKFILTFSFGVFLTWAGIAQDVHLSQYYTSNQSLNPAYTGNFDGDMRVVANSRSQWAQISPSIKTNIISIEKKITRRPNEFGLGCIIENDQVTSYFINTTRAYLSGSYQKNYKGHFFRFGIQGGFIARSINTGDQTFPGQWDYNTGQYDMPSNVQVNASSKNIDINTGVAWSHLFGKVRVSSGYALFHLTHPKEGLLPTSNPTPFRHVFNASAVYYYSPGLWFTPHILYMNSASAVDFIAGVNVNKKLTHNIGALVGGGYRGSTVNSDAAIVTAGMSYNRFIFGLSWDVNVSNLSRNTSSTKSAWEISLTYTTPSRTSNKVTMPCDRY